MLTDYPGVFDGKVAECGSIGCALKSTHISSQLNWMFVKAQDRKCFWEPSQFSPQNYRELQVHIHSNFVCFSLTFFAYLFFPIYVSLLARNTVIAIKFIMMRTVGDTLVILTSLLIIEILRLSLTSCRRDDLQFSPSFQGTSSYL